LLTFVLAGYFAWSLLNVASVYKEATSTPATYAPLVQAVQELNLTMGAVAGNVQQLSEGDRDFLEEYLIPVLSSSNQLLAKFIEHPTINAVHEQMARVDSYAARVNLNLALVAIVVTALTMGLSITMTLKDGQSQAKMKGEEEKFAKEKDRLLSEFTQELEKQLKDAKSMGKVQIKHAKRVGNTEEPMAQQPSLAEALQIMVKEEKQLLYRSARSAIMPWLDSNKQSQPEFERIKKLLEEAIGFSENKIFPEAEMMLGFLYVNNEENNFVKEALSCAKKFYDNYTKCLDYDSNDLTKLWDVFVIFTTTFCFINERRPLSQDDKAYFKEAVPTIIDATAQDDNEVKSMIDEILFD
jgi:hypothetical protein